jgi:uncharacterized protein GlcG (DUF336 family)
MPLTTERTQRIIAGAVKKATDMKLPISVAVVDDNGLMKGFLKMDGAWFTTGEIAIGKALAAVSTRRSNAETAERAGRPVFQYQLIHKGFVFAQGGEPIMESGRCIGAIGVSGAPTGPEDEEIAKVALSA